MAVYTPVAQPQLENFLAAYAVGALRSFEGISSGIENTNYFVDTEQGKYVLTIFEKLQASQLPFYLGLMHHLAQSSIPCPNPIATKAGQLQALCSGKPATLVTCLPGKDVSQILPAHCSAVGNLLACMHLAATSFDGTQENLRGLAWWRETAPKLSAQLPEPARLLLNDELTTQSIFGSSAAYTRLPRSAVHADLFRDNVLFIDDPSGPILGGVIDFYFAGVDTWVFDLAVAVNDWCVDDATGAIDSVRLHALLTSYQSVRQLTADEQLAWPYALRGAALRFWISRLDDWFSPRTAQMLTPKNPQQFERILIARRQDALTATQPMRTGR